MSFADREPLRHRYPHGPYSMLGPVQVADAEPGDVIEVSITGLRTIGWGWNSFPLGVGALPHDFAEPYVHYFTFDDARTIAEYTHDWSGWPDSNRRPPRPKRGALAKLRYSPYARKSRALPRDRQARVVAQEQGDLADRGRGVRLGAAGDRLAGPGAGPPAPFR